MTSDIATLPLSAAPTIGLALGGGVARGWAHIGVLRQLARAGLAPDMIAGTSAGAVVGACAIAGKLDALETWTRSLTPKAVRGLLDFAWSGGGLFGGARLAALLRAELGDRRIEDLPQRFTAIATELKTGHEAWLRTGNLVDAVRASFSLPGVFAPATIGGRLLADGALLNPCPTSAARAMGARLVISVSLHAGAFAGPPPAPTPSFASAAEEARERAAQRRPAASSFNPEHFLMRQIFGSGSGGPTLATVMVDALGVLMDRLSQARLAADPPDVLIAPRCDDIGLLDFHRADELIARGAEAAHAALPAIRRAQERLA